MFSLRLPNRRRLWLVGIFLFAVVLAAGISFLGAPPPRQITLATGDPDGGFAVLGREYQSRLQRMGLKVELRESTGSIANLKAVRDRAADVAFVQSGVTRVLEDETGNLCSLAAIGADPLWIFAHHQKDVSSLKDLAGHAVALGPAGSGTDALGRLLLGEFGVKPAKIVNLPMKQSRQALESGDVDFALLVSSPNAPVIRDLMANDDIQLVSLNRQAAIGRRLPYLRRIDLLAGSYDPARDRPPADVAMVAPVTMLVGREDLHPRVVEQLLIVAKKVHGSGSLLDDTTKYPMLETTELAPHVAAEKYMVSGESFLSRLLPYWGVRLVWQAQLLLLPIITVLVPLWRLWPAVYAFRINQILRRKYTALRDAESQINVCDDPEKLGTALEKLDALRSELETLSRRLPAYLQRDIYQWRLHVAMVRTEGQDRLRRLLPAASTNGQGSG
jgi:TRAP transporter TAXI family solute receptor